MATPKNVVQQLGLNVQVETDDDNIIITIKRKQRHGPSASGKTIIVASTQGNQVVTSDGIVLGLNAYVRPER